eukprot:gene13071-8278_t
MQYLPEELLINIHEYLEDEYKFKFLDSYNNEMKETQTRKVDLSNWYRRNFRKHQNYINIKKVYYVRNQARFKSPHLQNISHLLFDFNFNKPLSKLPESLTHLEFGFYFNQPVDNLPQSLTHLEFGERFNQPVDNLPKTLTYLEFGDDFNQKVDNLPQSLKHLKFGRDFNQPVNNLPKSLIYLKFGDDFNQKVDNLPATLTDLSFGSNFNQKTDKIPKSVINLNLKTRCWSVPFNHHWFQGVKMELYQNDVLIDKNY